MLKCVLCNESYATFEQLTVHIREAKHHVIPNRHFWPPTTSPSGLLPPPGQGPGEDILRDQIPLNRKLVRGQDVRIGGADQQTKDNLKCCN